MRKSAKVALWSLAAIVVAVGSAAAGFYVGFGVGARTMGAMAETNEAHDALSEVRSTMAALGKNDLDLSQHQLAINLRVALFNLGELSKTEAYVQCTDKDKRALADAASYVAMHPDPILFNPDPFLKDGMKFCASLDGQRATVTYMTSGKE
jgi:hypothetical protein